MTGSRTRKRKMIAILMTFIMCFLLVMPVSYANVVETPGFALATAPSGT
ncbi:MAG: hypothetical protein FWD21_04105 [Peptococcaceae bacterium]|nr:hypothetical protein [Peptococcaceae bacterium]